MSWQLVEEVLDHCPDLPYRQFRVLVVLAADARAETRQCRPGIERIRRQANCRHVRTAEDALRALRAKGLIKVAARAGKNHRAVYEILPIGGKHAVPATGSPRSKDVADAPDSPRSSDVADAPDSPRSKDVGNQRGLPTVQRALPTVSAPDSPRSSDVAPTYEATYESTSHVAAVTRARARGGKADDRLRGTTEQPRAPGPRPDLNGQRPQPRRADCPGCGRPFTADALADDAKWATASAGDLLCRDCGHHDPEGETP